MSIKFYDTGKKKVKTTTIVDATIDKKWSNKNT